MVVVVVIVIVIVIAMQVLNCTMQHAGEVICFMLPGGLEVSLCAAYRPNMDSCNHPVLYSVSLLALDYAVGGLRLLGINKFRLEFACSADW